MDVKMTYFVHSRICDIWWKKKMENIWPQKGKNNTWKLMCFVQPGEYLKSFKLSSPYTYILIWFPETRELEKTLVLQQY